MRDLLVDGEGVGLPHLPETPARGPGADIIGRAAGLLVDLPVDLQPSGWRFVDRPGSTPRARHRCTGEDLDELAEAYDGYEGPLKVQVAGPWTLAASLRLNRGERVVADPGAVADLVASLADGIRAYVADVRRLVPAARGRAAGRRAVAAGRARGVAADVVRASAGCARSTRRRDARRRGGARRARRRDRRALLPPVGAAAAAARHRRRGAGDRPHRRDTGPLGVGGGHARRRHRRLGRVPAHRRLPAPTRVLGPSCSRASSGRVWAADALRGLVVSPACGLAALTPEGARSVLRTALDTARRLGEDVTS